MNRLRSLLLVAAVAIGSLIIESESSTLGVQISGGHASASSASAKSTARIEGAYLYLESAGRPLNQREDGSLRPIEASDLPSVVSRSWVSLGRGGDYRHFGEGALCSIPEAFDTADGSTRTTSRDAR